MRIFMAYCGINHFLKVVFGQVIEESLARDRRTEASSHVTEHLDARESS
ncbi:MAG: hypothetical protein JXQ73_28600 [Phycisphaerae bacterium]|nr:hypothetical protein [Phycisphaerae bacterium]